MIQDVAERNGNINVDIVTDALKKSTYRIMGPAYMKAGMGDAGACHPRDNIALRYLAQRLDLGYDLFDSIMHAREVQAKRLAEKCLEYGNNITIVGKAYKPGVPYLNGSYSLLVGHYVEELGGKVHYYDLNTGDNDIKAFDTDVYLIGYWEEWVKNIDWNAIDKKHFTIIDPWRMMPDIPGQNVVHYGNTRPKIVEPEPQPVVEVQEENNKV
jgi:UDPglucose 6-dehydrogenase